jgi:hypothetical protein
MHRCFDYSSTAPLSIRIPIAQEAVWLITSTHFWGSACPPASSSFLNSSGSLILLNRSLFMACDRLAAKHRRRCGLDLIGPLADAKNGFLCPAGGNAVYVRIAGAYHAVYMD